MLDLIKQALFQRGYRLATRPYELNIVGLRTNYSQPNTFDDVLAVCYTDASGNWQLHRWSCTTDPGTYWLQNPMNPQGTAVLKPGQYAGCYAMGLHRGKYTALVQVKPVTVLRDADRNGSPNYNTSSQQTGMFGINIHRANQQGTTKLVDRYSAGCQVFANAEDFAQFLGLCQEHRQRYGNSFTYTLLAGLPFVPAQPQSVPIIPQPQAAKNGLRPVL